MDWDLTPKIMSDTVILGAGSIEPADTFETNGPGQRHWRRSARRMGCRTYVDRRRDLRTGPRRAPAALAKEKFDEDPLPVGDRDARLRLKEEIARYDLAKHIVELEVDGYTVLPPGKAAPTSFTERLRDVVLRIADERHAAGVENTVPSSTGLGYQLFHVLPEDRIFEEAVTNPVVLALVTYLAGYRARLTSTVALVKSNDTAPLHLHADNTGKLAVPWPEQSTGANVNWILTDYTRDNGCLGVVPGSHTWCRPPDDVSIDRELVTPVEVPAGSAVVWHSNLWHGAFGRRAEGQRVMFATLYSRPFMAHEELFSMTTTREMIERNAGRFGVLTGVLSAFPFDQRGPNLDFMVARQHEIGRWT